MKKLNKIFNIVFVYVVFITLMGIGWSYLTDYLTEINWFGDSVETRSWSDGTEYEYEVYGIRHIWYNTGLWCTSLTMTVRVVALLVFISENED
jgi:hypothetical protein